jgi:TonB-linked SusC/RagA family outer membrane protein
MKQRKNIRSKNRIFACLSRKIRTLFLLIALTGNAVVAQIPVTGVVRDAATGAPIAAVEIRVMNRKVSTVTDEKGRFSLSVPSTTDVLEVKAYDYNRMEVPVRGRVQIDIDLSSEVFKSYFKNLESVDGGIAQTALTASVKSIPTEEERPVLTADELIGTALAGDVRGITRSGAFNQGASLFVRGMNSLNANAQPLFVVDGVVWESLYDFQSIQSGFFSNPLENINLNDIESISVIKDGSSIYGSKASNGVILIKTKRSTSMVTKINVDVLAGCVTQPGTVPMMQGEDYRVFSSDLLNTLGYPGSMISELGFLEMNPSKPIYNTYHNNTNWNDQVYQTGTNNTYGLNVMGGDENAAFYFSLGYTGNTGVIKTTDLQRINTRFNADLKLTPAFDMDLNIGFTRTERTMQDDGADFYTSPTWLSKIKTSYMSPFTFTNSGQMTTDYDDADVLNIGNPTAILANSLNNTRTFRFNIGVSPVYQISPELKISTRFDYNLLKSNERRFVPMTGTAVRYIKDYGYSNNEVNTQVMRNQGLFDDTRLIWEKNIEESGRIKVLLGARYITNYLESDYAEEHNTGSDIYRFVTGDYDYLQVTGVNNQTNSLSDYMQAEYDYEGRYFLTGAISMDASSRFGKDVEGSMHLFGRSWGLFPAVNAAWLVSSEEFMGDIDAINFWKIRAGYGITGNDGIRDYDAMAYFSSIRYMYRANGLVIANLENSKLQWESTAKATLGMDISLNNDQLTFTVDLFSSKTDNLLTLKNSPIISGLGSYWSNGGSLTNKGYEVSANFKALNLKHLKWELGLNVGHYKSTVTYLPNGSYTISAYEGEMLTAVGYPVGSFYGYKSLGVFSTQTQAANAYTDPTTGATGYLSMKNEDGTTRKFMAGDVIFEDRNSDGIIDDADKDVIGDPNPDFYGGISSTLTVDRFSLNAQFNYSYGNQVYNYSRCLLESGKDFSNQTLVMLNRWTGEGQVTNQPRAVYGDPTGNARFSDRWIEDGSYIRLKTLTLSYEVPIKSTFLEGLKVWVSADNVLTFTKYLGLDPEFSAGNSVYLQGIDAGLVPLTRGYTIGIKLNL